MNIVGVVVALSRCVFFSHVQCPHIFYSNGNADGLIHLSIFPQEIHSTLFATLHFVCSSRRFLFCGLICALHSSFHVTIITVIL